MPRLDKHHQIVKNALEKDGWIITHDPYPLSIGKKNLFADLGAETLVSAERDSQKIVVEIKGFFGASSVKDLQNAIGQYVVYQNILEIKDIERELYLAIPEHAAEEIFEVELGQLLLENNVVKVIVFDVESEEIIKWLS